MFPLVGPLNELQGSGSIPGLVDICLWSSSCLAYIIVSRYTGAWLNIRTGHLGISVYTALHLIHGGRFISKGLLNTDLYAASYHTCLERDALVTSFAVLQVESTNNQLCGTSQSMESFYSLGFSAGSSIM